MKFSYKLLKLLVPQIKNKKDIIEKLNLHSFEAVDADGDVVDITLPPNRYCDAAGHWGMAKEISTIYSRNFQFPISNFQFPKTNKAPFRVEIKDKNLCPRYIGWYFENVKIAPSPKWMQEILKSCGFRPINNVVDIMNYAMLETGQPLHAFDFDKLITHNSKLKTILVRRAKKGEKITTLDNEEKALDEDILVIADEKEPLAIAGVKGGKKAEVDRNTKRIIIEAANFDAPNIYKSSKKLNLITDASIRFGRGLSPELSAVGISRAAELLKKITYAKTGGVIDVYLSKQPKKIIKFDIEKFKNFIGLDLDKKRIVNYLSRLGFIITQNSRLRQGFGGQANFKIQNSFLVEIPKIRLDIETFEDLAEEIIRLYGFNNLKSTPPRIHLHPSGFEDQIVLKDKIRKALIGFGLDEVYNYSFISRINAEHARAKAAELENPVSGEFQHLRPSLRFGLLKNIEENFRFFDEIKIFEIGKTFNMADKIGENLRLGIAIASKKKETFLTLKGVVGGLFKKIGLVDYLLTESLEVVSDNKIIGRLIREKKANLAEIDLDKLLKLIVEEHEYKPLSKYPSVMRDISVLVAPITKVGNIMQAIQEINLRLIEDVDLIDEFEREGKRSLTFRIIFQAEDRTLTDKEVNEEMDKITAVLKRKFKAEVR